MDGGLTSHVLAPGQLLRVGRGRAGDERVSESRRECRGRADRTTWTSLTGAASLQPARACVFSFALPLLPLIRMCTCFRDTKSVPSRRVFCADASAARAPWRRAPVRRGCTWARRGSFAVARRGARKVLTDDSGVVSHRCLESPGAHGAGVHVNGVGVDLPPVHLTREARGRAHSFTSFDQDPFLKGLFAWRCSPICCCIPLAAVWQATLDYFQNVSVSATICRVVPTLSVTLRVYVCLSNSAYPYLYPSSEASVPPLIRFVLSMLHTASPLKPSAHAQPTSGAMYRYVPTSSLRWLCNLRPAVRVVDTGR